MTIFSPEIFFPVFANIIIYYISYKYINIRLYEKIWIMIFSYLFFVWYLYFWEYILKNLNLFNNSLIFTFITPYFEELIKLSSVIIVLLFISKRDSRNINTFFKLYFLSVISFITLENSIYAYNSWSYLVWFFRLLFSSSLHLFFFFLFYEFFYIRKKNFLIIFLLISFLHGLLNFGLDYNFIFEFLLIFPFLVISFLETYKSNIKTSCLTKEKLIILSFIIISFFIVSPLNFSSTWQIWLLTLFNSN